ncbi:DNA circularization protein [Xenorhabdus bovienii]|uniref:DNA circularization protein n=1 Tax=Xenorhabdus bovienii TaxID=40576 RepID=UPI0023B12C45|nr:DNA circularization N-terminal domain-containing protein [Xenorhabdus bovienii]MDE9477019.1 DNA circularization N-terminal domain-containing protein [Xenorhabdus bovienii]MDE9529999.1 DNA circularization N-terminal domain-containing protein [Xenorhabdus bovienii]
MAFIKDAISSLLGGDNSSWKWSEHLRPASFRGVPFAVVSGESVFGRRQAVHEYPYRDTAWIEDLGRATRKITLRGFIIQDSMVYDAPDVITQRKNLVAACETGSTGTLIHPTLGELTVSVTESGLRMTENAESGRVFEFTLTVIESGLQVFAVTNSTKSATEIKQNWFRAYTTTLAKYVAIVRGEIRSVVQGMKIIKATANQWIGMVTRSMDEVTNLSDMLKTTLGSERYGRYQRGKIGGTVSGATGIRSRDNQSRNEAEIVKKTTAAVVMSRKSVSESIDKLTRSLTIEEFSQAAHGVVDSIIISAGSTDEKIAIFENLSAFQNTRYQQSSTDRHVTEMTVLLLVVLSAGAMAQVASEFTPANNHEANKLQRRVCHALDTALVMSGDLGMDDIYQSLMSLRYEFVTSAELKGAESGRLAQFSLPAILPSLNVANRIYQDSGRSDELIQATNPRHPAFMPVKFKALRK